MTIKEWVNIQEIHGFNYTDYLVKILQAINRDDFTELKAITESDVLDGLLPDKEIEKLGKEKERVKEDEERKQEKDKKEQETQKQQEEENND